MSSRGRDDGELLVEGVRGGRVIGNPRAWLFGIAQHEFAETLRRRRVSDDARRRLSIGPIELTDQELERTEALVDLEAEAARLNELLARLSADEADALRARIVDEREYGDIADELQCSQAVVPKRVSRGLARLRQAMRATA
jgi:RNA polymerase sigma factor (sigma-70 family)